MDKVEYWYQIPNEKTTAIRRQQKELYWLEWKDVSKEEFTRECIKQQKIRKNRILIDGIVCRYLNLKTSKQKFAIRLQLSYGIWKQYLKNIEWKNKEHGRINKEQEKKFRKQGKRMGIR